MMKFSDEQVEFLAAPLHVSNVKHREQAGRKLSYVEGWHLIAEANRIFGFDGWNRETVETKLVSERERKIGKHPHERDGWGVSYIAKVRVTVGDIVRDGVGSGHGIDADVGLAHESAIKEAETDAMKRALMTFGNPFGLALYDKAQENVDRTPPGPSMMERCEAVEKAMLSKETPEALTALWHTLADDMKEKFRARFAKLGAELKAKVAPNGKATFESGLHAGAAQ